MFLDFFYFLKKYGIPVSLQEYLNLLEATQEGLPENNVDNFYSLCKTTLIKHEHDYDKFDQIFGAYFKGMKDVELAPPLKQLFDDEWIRKNIDRVFTPEEMALVESLGGLEALMKRFAELQQEQKERHEGGNKWVGTGGTSAFGNSGYNPEGMRVGGESTHKRAIKVWEKRDFRNLADDVEINTRNAKMALRRLREFAREGALEELDLDTTIKKTASNAGYLDINMIPQKRNNVKVLIFFDVGGSMDPFVKTCSELFSAAKAEFKHLEYFYFHNCIYENVWKDNKMRWGHEISTLNLLQKYNSSYKVILVGDAYMSSTELLYKGGSVDHHNEETGAAWIQEITKHFPNTVWINPIQPEDWHYSDSIQIVKKLLRDRMYPLTIAGLGDAVKSLMKKNKIK